MAYIGKEPIVGNFQKCDAITVVNGQAAYTLQVSSTNVVPESANHMLVSLNGILQAPVTSFTVSGATLTFASNLATGDVIDFVILLGNVLDLGTPSDGTVTNAKLASDLISGETDIGGAIADADLFLMDDGAGGTLRKTAASRIKTYIGSGLSAASQWRVTSNFTGDAEPITSNWEEADAPTSYGILGSSITESSGVFTFPSTGYYLILGQARWQASNSENSIDLTIYTTHDNATYAAAAATSAGTNHYGGAMCNYIFDVTSTSNCKCKLYLANGNDSNTIIGSSTVHSTGLTFIRLGDT